MIVPYWLEDDEEAEDQYKAILAEHLDHFWEGHPGRTLLFIDLDNEVVAGIVHLNNYQPMYKTADFTALMFDKRAFTRRNLYFLYHWLFVELELGRVNMVTQQHNLAAQKGNLQLGAKYEATLEGFWGDEPALVYGLLRKTALEKMERWKPNVEEAHDLDD